MGGIQPDCKHLMIITDGRALNLLQCLNQGVQHSAHFSTLHIPRAGLDVIAREAIHYSVSNPNHFVLVMGGFHDSCLVRDVRGDDTPNIRLVYEHPPDLKHYLIETVREADLLIHEFMQEEAPIIIAPFMGARLSATPSVEPPQAQLHLQGAYEQAVVEVNGIIES